MNLFKKLFIFQDKFMHLQKMGSMLNQIRWSSRKNFNVQQNLTVTCIPETSQVLMINIKQGFSTRIH
jgi:hypothetical protein